MTHHRRLLSFSKVRRLRSLLHLVPSPDQSASSLSKPVPQRPRLHYHFLVLSLSITALLILLLSPSARLSTQPHPHVDARHYHVAHAAIVDFYSARNPTRPDPSLFTDGDANIRLLVDIARLPPVFTTRLSASSRQQLLRRLTVDSNGIVVFESNPKIVIVDLQNGLGNRLRALASTLEFAYNTRRIPIVLWAADAHINATMPNLFHPDIMRNLIVIDRPVSWPVRPRDVISEPSLSSPVSSMSYLSRLSDSHPSFSSFEYVSFMDKDKHFVRSASSYLGADSSKHIYVKTAYILNSRRNRNYRLVNTFMQALTPSPVVMKLVHDVERRCGGTDAIRRMVGVHIRARTIERDNSAVDHECEYSVAGARRTDSYRLMSTPANFIPEMRRVRREWAYIIRFSVGLTPAPSSLLPSKSSTNHGDGKEMKKNKKSEELTVRAASIAPTRSSATTQSSETMGATPLDTDRPDAAMASESMTSLEKTNVMSAMAPSTKSGDESYDPSAVIPVDPAVPPRFYVSADSLQSLRELQSAFSAKDVVSLPRTCDDRGAECIMYAFADLILLSRTAAMLQSGWSSFSEAAERLRIRPHGLDANRNDGYLVKRSGDDFGGPSFWERKREFFNLLARRVFGDPRAVVISQAQRRALCEARRKNASTIPVGRVRAS